MYMVDSSGATVATYDYGPYGKVITATGTMASTNPLRYRGYYYDAETKLFFCYSRYYDPATGRFINADSCASTDQEILGSNMFAYCNNNPICYEDKQGDSATVAGGICGAIFGFFGAVSSELTDNIDSFRWDKVWQCTISTAATGAAAGFVADISIASFGVVPAIFASAAGGAIFSAINSVYTQETLKNNVDAAKVFSDAVLGGVTNGLCTGTSGQFSPSVTGGIREGLKFALNQVGTEVSSSLKVWGNFIVNDFIPTLITGAGAFWGGMEYDYITRE